MERKAVSLYEFTGKIKNAIENELNDGYWIIGEISELRINQNGHCYLELIEKEDQKIIARIRATIWSNTFRMLKPFFETTSGQSLSEGIKVMVKASVEFHELFGLSLNIRDIDPAYTIGDMAKRRQEIILQLEDDGVIDMNKSLYFPLIPRKIAIISSETAAGYEDFVNQLENNPYGYKFYHKLFNAFMQGEKTGDSIISALDRIYRCDNFFDVVVVIRGGGSKAELSSFDHYWLAFNIAQFPTPVLTGIGHERDQSIADIVAYQSLKTPTAVADFLIAKMEDTENELNQTHIDFKDAVKYLLSENNITLNRLSSQFFPFVKNKIGLHNISLDYKMNRLKLTSINVLEMEEGFLDMFLHKTKISLHNSIKDRRHTLSMATTILRSSAIKMINTQTHILEKAEYFSELSDPINILEKGYSITLKNGKPLRSKLDVVPGDELQTKLKDGLVFSKTFEK